MVSYFDVLRNTLCLKCLIGAILLNKMFMLHVYSVFVLKYILSMNERVVRFNVTLKRLTPLFYSLINKKGVF